MKQASALFEISHVLFLGGFMLVIAAWFRGVLQ